MINRKDQDINNASREAASKSDQCYQMRKDVDNL